MTALPPLRRASAPSLRGAPRQAGWRSATATLSICTAALLGACAAQPPSGQDEPLVEVPAAWSDDAAAAAAATPTPPPPWWALFGEDLLSQIVEQALQRNPDIAGARAALAQAQAQRDLAAAARGPTVGLTGSIQRARSGGRSAENEFRAGVDAGWSPDPFGVLAQAQTAEEATVRQRTAELGEAELAVAAQVALEYIGLRGGQARLAIARDNLAIQRETLQITEWRAQAGLVSALEVEQARAATEQTLAQLPALQTGIVRAVHALAVLAGRPPASLDALLGAEGSVPVTTLDPMPDVPAETLRQRPDVRAAEQAVASAAARLAQADAARMPNFRLGGSLSVGAVTLAGLSSGAALASSLLASVSLPLFDGGAATAQVMVQRAALRQAHAAYRGTVLKALREVEDALVALRSGRERQARLQQAAQSAAAAAQLARYRYGSGLADFQTVLETQRNALATRDALASARADLSAGQVRLVQALGGGWRETGVPLVMTKARP